MPTDPILLDPLWLQDQLKGLAVDLDEACDIAESSIRGVMSIDRHPDDLLKRIAEMRAAAAPILEMFGIVDDSHSAEACKRKFDEVPKVAFGAAPIFARHEPYSYSFEVTAVLEENLGPVPVRDPNPFLAGSTGRCIDCDPARSCFFSSGATCARQPPKVR